jgi:general secretion pathway protein D
MILSAGTNSEAAALHIRVINVDPKASAAAPGQEATNSSTPQTQISIKSKFIEFPEDFAAKFWLAAGGVKAGEQYVTAILTPAQTQTILSAVEHTPNADLLSESSVTTLSSRQCEVQVVDLVYVVTDLTTNANGVNYKSERLPIGPTLDFVPTISKSRREVELKIIATLTEFLGYDDPTNKIPVNVNGKKIFAAPPLPRIHISSATNECTVPDGHTLVLGGLVSENISRVKDKVPVLGDLPLVGRLFRSEHSTTDKKHVVVLVTPTLIDPAGNRVHGESSDAGSH